MTPRILPSALIAFLLSATAASGLSDQLVHLQKFVQEEEALVDAARRFDRMQQALIKWDRTLAFRHGRAGESSLARTKQSDATRRIALINEAWQFVLGYYPNNARATNYYGELYYDFKGDVANAIRYWRLALSIDEKLSAAHNNLGIHHFHSGEYRKGLHHLGRALKLEPKNPDYLFNLAQMYLIHFPELEARFKMPRSKLYKEAMRLSRDAAKYAPDDYDILQDYAVNFFAAQNFGVKPDWSEAAEAWVGARKVATSKTKVFYTLINEGRAWKEAEEWGKALERFEEAHAYRPESIVLQKLIDEARENLKP